MDEDTRTSAERVRDEIANEARRAAGKAPLTRGSTQSTIRASDGPDNAIAVGKEALRRNLDPMYTKDNMDAERAAARARANRKEAEAEGQKFAKGGAVKGRGNGIATKGHGKGKMR